MIKSSFPLYNCAFHDAYPFVVDTEVEHKVVQQKLLLGDKYSWMSQSSFGRNRG